MSVRATDASIVRQLLLAVLVAVFAVSAVTLSVAADADQKADQEEEQQAEKSGEKSDEAAESEAGAKDAEDSEPQVGGNAAVPRPLKKVKLPSKVDPKTGKKVLVLTNEGLVEIFGERREELPSAAVPYETPSADADASAEDEPDAGSTMAPGERTRRINEIRLDLRRLRSNLLRYRNPLLPRPDVTDDEAAEQRGLDNVQRIELTNEKIAALEAELTELERDANQADSESSP